MVETVASDGLLARDQGPWAREKLTFLEQYLPAALGITRKKHRTHYLDLYAGTGMNLFRPRTPGRMPEEYPGSPMIALNAFHEGKEKERVAFSRFHFCNLHQDEFDALERRMALARARTPSFPPEGCISHRLGNSNRLINEITQVIGVRDYVFAFLDIEGPTNLEFSTVEALASCSESVDLYVLFPLLQRLLPYEEQLGEGFEGILDSFFGVGDWREYWRDRRTPAQARQLKRDLLNLYRHRLGQLWRHVEIERKVRGGGGYYYLMLFATNHPVPARVSEEVSSKHRPQTNLFT